MVAVVFVLTVNYALTDLGRSLFQTTRLPRSRAQDHMDDVHAHRQYDTAPDPRTANRVRTLTGLEGVD